MLGQRGAWEVPRLGPAGAGPPPPRPMAGEGAGVGGLSPAYLVLPEARFLEETAPADH